MMGQKQYQQHEHEQNKKKKKKQEIKMGGKTTVWIFQTTDKRNLIRENMEMAKKGKS